MTPDKLKNILEALLLSADHPLTVAQMDDIFSADEDRPTRDEIRKALHDLDEDYASRGFELKQVASGFRLQVKQDFAPWVGRLWEEKPARYTRALLETLALIAYRQPVTRGEIEEVRGVSVSSNIIRTLEEREWIRVLGHKDVPGKPALYGTTRQFLDYFNLKSLDDLPSLAEIKDLDKMYPELALEEQAAANEGETAQEAEAAQNAEADAEQPVEARSEEGTDTASDAGPDTDSDSDTSATLDDDDNGYEDADASDSVEKSAAGA